MDDYTTSYEDTMHDDLDALDAEIWLNERTESGKGVTATLVS